MGIIIHYQEKPEIPSAKIHGESERYDEGSYWETNNADLLKKKMEFLNAKINELADALETLPYDKNDTTISIADKIEKLLKEKLWKRKNPD